MGPSVATTVAFATSGAFWLTALVLLDGESWDPSFLLRVAGFVVVGSVLLGIRRDHLVSTLAVLWLVAVAIVGLLGVFYATAGFAIWVTFGLIGLHLLGQLPDPAPAAFADDPR